MALPLNSLLEEARTLARERQWFLDRFPPAPPGAPFPSFTWEELTRQLEDLTENLAFGPGLRQALTVLRRQAPHLPPELVLRTMLVLAGSAQEEFQPFTEGEPGTEDSSMP